LFRVGLLSFSGRECDYKVLLRRRFLRLSLGIKVLIKFSIRLVTSNIEGVASS
jgi:hypothetical protein